MRIAILDTVQFAVGMKLIFPDADYFCSNTYTTIYQKQDEFRSLYGFEYREDIDSIISDNYDIFMVIYPLFDNFKTNRAKHDIDTFNLIMNIINKNSFKKILFFDDYDYDYDPNDYLQCDKPIIFFKRCYLTTKLYKENVFSFPFMIMGRPREIMWRMLKGRDDFNNLSPRKNEIFWAGALYRHINEIGYPVHRDRFASYSKIQSHIVNYHISNDNFINGLATFKFGADILGVGDPNIRTIELLMARTLIIQEKNNLQWPFERGVLVPPELMFDSEEEFIRIKSMLQDDSTYQKYINEQNRLFDNYFTKEWLRSYIEQSAKLV